MNYRNLRKKFNSLKKNKKVIQLISLITRFFFTTLIGHLWTIYVKIKLFLWGVEYGRNFYASGNIRIYNDGKIKIGNNVRLISGSGNYVGADKKISIWVGRNGYLEIEDCCGISNATIIAFKRVIIKKESFIGGGAEIYDTDFHAINEENRVSGIGIPPSGVVQIGPRAFIGGFAMILKNVSIGYGSVIGARSVVTKDVMDNEIWGGNPAKFIKKIN